jgi:hypothetical protein
MIYFDGFSLVIFFFNGWRDLLLSTIVKKKFQTGTRRRERSRASK